MDSRDSRTKELIDGRKEDNLTKIMEQINKFDNMMAFKERTCQLEIDWWVDELFRCKDLLLDARRSNSDYRIHKLLQLIKVAEVMKNKVSKFRDSYGASERGFHFDNYGELHAFAVKDRSY